MALPSSGQISLSQVAVELGRASNATTSLGESAVRSLAGVPSGAISLDNLHGKSASFTATITANQQEMNLATWAAANGWNGSSAATITINSGVYIWSDNTSVAALTTGSFPGGLTIINNGYIIGKGGKGSCSISYGGAYINGQPGGPALSVGSNTTINSSSGYICGGGGGGGGVYQSGYSVIAPGGGGAGGGQGGDGTSQSTPNTVGGGGAGGAPGSAGSGGAPVGANGQGAGGGGRIVPGSTYSYNPNASTYNYTSVGGGAGVTGSASIGGFVSAVSIGTSVAGPGGSAGGIGGAHVLRKNASTNQVKVGAGGGGWGASANAGVYVGSGWTSLPGGAAGVAVNLNGNSITWSGGFPSGNVFGAVA